MTMQALADIRTREESDLKDWVKDVVVVVLALVVIIGGVTYDYQQGFFNDVYVSE